MQHLQQETAAPAPVLIFAWGNPSRGDDALGPLFHERFAALAANHPEWGEIDFLTDYQLQVEHAVDLRGRARVLFVDASANATAPCSLERIFPARDSSFTTHALSPQAVLQAYTSLGEGAPPASWLLGIRGESFELGEEISESACRHLEAAFCRAADWVGGPERRG